MCLWLYYNIYFDSRNKINLTNQIWIYQFRLSAVLSSEHHSEHKNRLISFTMRARNWTAVIWTPLPKYTLCSLEYEIKRYNG